jgi:hypothetical protein
LGFGVLCLALNDQTGVGTEMETALNPGDKPRKDSTNACPEQIHGRDQKFAGDT